MPKRCRSGTQRHFLRALAVLCALGLALAADAKTLYKLVEKNGKVSYVDKVPKGFDGEVTEIIMDAPPTPNANPPPAPPAPPRAPATAVQEGKRDINTERKEARARLEAALDRAREKLAAAKKALSDGVDVDDDELQVIQQRYDASGAKPGAAGPRSNCFQQMGGDGRPVWICPVMVPGEKYRDRQKLLEDRVRSAEAEVAAAEDAYRRGTD